MEISVRSFRLPDAEPLGLVFHRAVHEGAASAYSDRERAAWSPAPPAGEPWTARLAKAETLVAESGGVPVGFMSLVPDRGYLDLAFVVPEVMGRGVAPALYAVLETRARARGLGRLTTDASLLGERFFTRQGWCVIERQTVVRRGVALRNSVMEKLLPMRKAAA